MRVSLQPTAAGLSALIVYVTTSTLALAQASLTTAPEPSTPEPTVGAVTPAEAAPAPPPAAATSPSVTVQPTVDRRAAATPAVVAAPPTPATLPPPIKPNRSPEPETDAASGAWKLRPPKVSGYIQVHFRHAFGTGDYPGQDHQVDFDDFRVQRARLELKGEVQPWLGYDLEVDPRAPEVRGMMRDAFLAFKLIPRHELRVGQQKTQFGYENVESSTKLYAVNRAEVSDALSRGINLRDVGVGLIGNIKLGAGFRLEDAFTVVNGAGLNVQADDTKRKDFWGRLGLRYKRERLGGLVVRLGASGGIGDHVDPGDDPSDPADDFRLEFKRLGADLEVDQRWFFVAAEYVQGWDHDVTNDERSDDAGYYVSLVGKTPWQVGPTVRYDALGDEFERWTFGAFYGPPSATFRLLLNYEYRKLRDGLRADDKAYVWLQVRF